MVTVAIRPDAVDGRRSRAARALAGAGRAVLGTGRAVAALVAAAALGGVIWGLSVWAAAVGLIATVAVSRAAAGGKARRVQLAGLNGHLSSDVDALEAVRVDAWWRGGGAFIGLHPAVGVVHAPAEAACLVLGPPRRGKTSSVIIPSVLCAPGAVLVTSTKPDVLMATAAARSRYGRIFVFDPTGQASGLPDGVIRLRWSPLDAAGTWESARRLSAQMVAASPAAKGTRHESHWTSRAAALLGPLLYAAALAGRDMVDVVSWVLQGDVTTPQTILGEAADGGLVDAVLASQVLEGVDRAADQERQSIWSATADVIDVYTTAEALQAATGSNFDPAAFVRSADTIYIAAPAEHQNACAPLVVALIEAIRDAQYRRHHAEVIAGQTPGVPVSLILDEVANVAPIASLPALVSEAGGQGLHVLAAVQDLSQVRGRWGAEIADGFLSLFQHVLVLGGIRDTRTLEAFSALCGEWDRPHHTTSYSIPVTRAAQFPSWSTSTTTVRQRRVTVGEVYGLPDGQALYFWGSAWGLVRLAPHFGHQRWRTALAAAPKRLLVWDQPPPIRQAHRASTRRRGVGSDAGTPPDAAGLAAQPERTRGRDRGMGGVA